MESMSYSSTDSSEIDKHEDAKAAWYEALESLSSQNQTEPFYRLYDISDNESMIIKIFENEASFVAEGTTGLVTWEVSFSPGISLSSCGHKNYTM
jgi:hypothetical protein